MKYFLVIVFERVIAFDQPGSQLQYEERYKTLLNDLSADHPFIISPSNSNSISVTLIFVETMGYRKHCLESTKLFMYVNSITNEGTKHKFLHTVSFDFLLLFELVLTNNHKEGRG